MGADSGLGQCTLGDDVQIPTVRGFSYIVGKCSDKEERFPCPSHKQRHRGCAVEAALRVAWRSGPRWRILAVEWTFTLLFGRGNSPRWRRRVWWRWCSSQSLPSGASGQDGSGSRPDPWFVPAGVGVRKGIVKNLKKKRLKRVLVILRSSDTTMCLFRQLLYIWKLNVTVFKKLADQ